MGRVTHSEQLLGMLVLAGIGTSISLFGLAVYKKLRRSVTDERDPEEEDETAGMTKKELQIFGRFMACAEDGSDDERVRHYGACHCGLQQFRLDAPPRLAAAEAPAAEEEEEEEEEKEGGGPAAGGGGGGGALRYPFVRARRRDFHLERDESVACYFTGVPAAALGGRARRRLARREAVGVGGRLVTAHLFCARCGTHVAHAPCVPSDVVHVNALCLRGRAAAAGALEVVRLRRRRRRPGGGGGGGGAGVVWPGAGAALPVDPDEVKRMAAEAVQTSQLNLNNARIRQQEEKEAAAEARATAPSSQPPGQGTNGTREPSATGGGGEGQAPAGGTKKATAAPLGGGTGGAGAGSGGPAVDRTDPPFRRPGGLGARGAAGAGGEGGPLGGGAAGTAFKPAGAAGAGARGGGEASPLVLFHYMTARENEAYRGDGSGVEGDGSGGEDSTAVLSR